jgi:hypothetical protein
MVYSDVSSDLVIILNQYLGPINGWTERTIPLAKISIS